MKSVWDGACPLDITRKLLESIAEVFE